MLARLALGALALLASAAGCGGSAASDDELAGGRLEARSGGLEVAVERVATGNPPRRDIVVLDPRGRALRIVRAPAAGRTIGGISWSPDGSRIAYTRELAHRTRRTEYDVSYRAPTAPRLAG